MDYLYFARVRAFMETYAAHRIMVVGISPTADEVFNNLIL